MLKSHLDEWKQKHFPVDIFYEDGIINETIFNEQSTKVLLIAKEPNGKNHTETEDRMSFCEEWNNTRPSYGFAHRIGEWTVGILENFPEFSAITMDKKLDALKKIAFMNVKKSAGGSSTKMNNLHELAIKQAEFIRLQVSIINPDLIILCLSHSEIMRNLLFPDAQHKWHDCGYAINVARIGKARIIDFYHPSSRNVPAAAYCLLKNVVQSATFARL